jgi:hypothetical protein
MLMPSFPTPKTFLNRKTITLAVVLLGVAAVGQTSPAHALFGIKVSVSLPGVAQEATQILNKILLGKQLIEQEMINEQTLLAILPQGADLNGLNQVAGEIARDALGSLGMPYELGAALGTHTATFQFDPAEVYSWETVMPRYGLFMDELDRAAFENVAAIAQQQEAALAQRAAVDAQVALSQTSLGANQALMVSNQLAGATISTLQQIEAGLQSKNYIESRKVAAEMADLRAAYAQRSYDTRDFITGPMPSAGAGPGGAGGAGSFVGM